MKICKVVLRVAVISALGVLATASQAWAYFDPGAGSMLLQALAAGLMAVVVFWKRIKDMLRKMFWSKEKNHEG